MRCVNRWNSRFVFGAQGKVKLGEQEALLPALLPNDNIVSASSALVSLSGRASSRSLRRG